MTSPVGRDDAAAQLDRILASPGFARNERLSRFLRFLVDRTLDGKAAELKESVIGVEVFGRRPEYDPRGDSIVRTEAGRLRTRLLAYYAEDGRTDRIVIDVPKGAYVAVFRRQETPMSPARPLRARQVWFAVSVATAIAAVVASLAWSQHRARAPIRIAVLPLVDRSGTSSGDLFADGLTDEINHNLSVIEGLEVRSRTSSFVFKGMSRDARDIARQLQVEYLLEGSVLRDAARLRIDAQLIRAADDTPVWSGQFDRRAADIFAVQDEISLAIVNNLRLHLGRGRRRYETSVEAYALYLRGAVLSVPAVGHDREHRETETPDQRFQHSIESYENAIALDPNFAPAYAGLAYDYALRSVQFPLTHPADELDRMRAAAAKALELDGLLPETHHALAMTYARDGKWALAERSFLKSIELDPNHAATYSDYAYWLLAVQGRHGEALRQLHAAATADPLSADVLFTTALVLVQARQFDEAASYCGRLRSPAVCLAHVRTGQLRFAETVDSLVTNPELLRNPQTRGLLGFALARSGRRAEAEKMVAGSTFPNEQALIFAGLGDAERTYDALKRMSTLGPQRVGLYLNAPEFALLRDDNRLPAFRMSVGLLP